MKTRGNDDTISGRTTDRAASRAKTVEAKSSHLWVGRVVSTDSQQKRLDKQFRAPLSIQRRAIKLDEEPGDDIDEHIASVVHAKEVHDKTIIDPVEVYVIP